MGFEISCEGRRLLAHVGVGRCLSVSAGRHVTNYGATGPVSTRTMRLANQSPAFSEAWRWISFTEIDQWKKGLGGEKGPSLASTVN